LVISGLPRHQDNHESILSTVDVSDRNFCKQILKLKAADFNLIFIRDILLLLKGGYLQRFLFTAIISLPKNRLVRISSVVISCELGFARHKKYREASTEQSYFSHWMSICWRSSQLSSFPYRRIDTQPWRAYCEDTACLGKVSFDGKQI
jgi:hypothetical protein